LWFLQIMKLDFIIKYTYFHDESFNKYCFVYNVWKKNQKHFLG
jgi:hypothetical protein